jgi:hypothetical protein
MISVDRAAASQHLLPQAIEQTGKNILDVVPPLYTHPQVLEPPTVHDAHMFKIHDVLEHESAAASQGMAERKPHLHGQIIALVQSENGLPGGLVMRNADRQSLDCRKQGFTYITTFAPFLGHPVARNERDGRLIASQRDPL